MIYIKDRAYMMLILSDQERWCPICKKNDVVFHPADVRRCCGTITLSKTMVNEMLSENRLCLVADTGLMFFAGFHND